MKAIAPNLLLIDDDKDDCLFFKEALDELPVTAELTTVHNGEQLMDLLTEGGEAVPSDPLVLFLDLNMPRKNGFEVLSELKQDDKLKGLPVIIFSTYFEPEEINQLYDEGAHYYIRKPVEFSQLKKLIYQALMLITGNAMKQPPKDDFVLKGDITPQR
jgi:CheY-like chemotaxis protein